MLHEPPLRALVGAIRHRAAPTCIESNVRSFLQGFGVRGEDLREMATALSGRRLLVYRALVHSRFRSAIEVSIPLAAGLLGADRIDEQVACFIDERASGSAYLRDVASEFVRWASPRWLEDPELPGFVRDLARHELALFEIAAAPDAQPASFACEVDVSRALVFRGPVRVLRYEYPVHRTAESQDARAIGLEPEAVALLAYRDRGHAERLLELSPAAAAILELALDGATRLGDAIRFGSQAADVAVDDALLAGMAALLADLAERGVLLGAAVA